MARRLVGVGLSRPADLSGAGMQDMRKGCMDIDSGGILDVRQGTTERTLIWSNKFTEKQPGRTVGWGVEK